MHSKGIGFRIRQNREKLNLTQEDIATKLGFNKSTIQRYENGEIKKIKLPVLSAIAEVLEVSTDYLLGKTNDPARSASSITEDEQALLAAYRTLDADGKIKAEEYLSALAKLHGLTMQITGGLYVLSDPGAEITNDDIKELTED